MIKLILFFFPIVTMGVALSEDDKSVIWAEFRFISILPQHLYPDTQQLSYCAASVANSDNKTHFFVRSEDDTHATLAIAMNENEEGKTLAHSLIADAREYYNINGFRVAPTLLEYCLWTFYVRDIPEEAQVSALYATINRHKLKIVNLGKLWVGLFRRGQITYMTSPFQFGVKNMLLPEEFLADVGDDGFFQTRHYEYNWLIEDDDLLIITRADLPSRFLEVVQIAVHTALEENTPLSRLVSNLQNYYYGENNESKIFVAVRVKDTGNVCTTAINTQRLVMSVRS